jgi:chorismate mutase/prephenate dehydratase
MEHRTRGAEDTRRTIAAIDRDIHDLLLRRAKLKAVESGDGSAIPAPLRTAHAAGILRAVLARHSGCFPLRALVRIWSDILFAEDTGTTLHVFAGGDAPGFRDLARCHFGCTMPIVNHSSAAAVAHACADDPSALGLLPPPDSVENGQAWWQQLAPAGTAGPRIAQSLPFVVDDGGEAPLPRGCVIGTIEQQATGADTTILRLECESELSRGRLQTLLRQAGFDIQILAGAREAANSSASRLLVANRGFVAANDARLASLTDIADNAIERADVVGGFADPFDPGESAA